MAGRYSDPAPSVRNLSPRQAEVARAFSRGLSHKQIASELRISPSTVRNHLVAIYRVLGVRSKIELAMLLSGEAYWSAAGDSER